MKYSATNRRTFLRGAGGIALGLPLLPSLFSLKEADALAATPGPKRFVFISRLYGCVPRSAMYPSAAILTQSADLYPGHKVSWGKLQRTVSGTNAAVTAALSAPADQFTQRIADKMNVMRGWDIPCDVNHQTGASLGNYAANNQGAGGSDDNQVLQSQGNVPTIDQIMAYSPTFYPGGVRERFIYEGKQYTAPGPYSFYYQNTQTKSGPVSAVESNRSTSYWFDKLFSGTPPQSPTTPATTNRTPLVDRVLEDYKSLRQGNKRLSAADRIRLDEFVGRLAELQKKIAAIPSLPPAMCNAKKPATDTGTFSAVENSPGRAQQKYAIWSELIAMAFACDATRIAVLPAGEIFLDVNGDYHNDYSHQYNDTGRHPVLIQTNQSQLKLCVLPLVSKLDVEESNGNTILDNSLVMWGHEHGFEAHYTLSVPVVTFGSAGGYFKTGQYFDFRRKSPDALSGISGEEHTGLTYQRWLATVLQSMGLPKSEWEKSGRPGYGPNVIGALFKGRHLPDVINKASDVPPMLRA